MYGFGIHSWSYLKLSIFNLQSNFLLMGIKKTWKEISWSARSSSKHLSIEKVGALLISSANFREEMTATARYYAEAI